MIPDSLRHEFRVIDAHHEVDTRLRLEIDLLRILLRKARGEPASVHDTWKVRDIVERYPEFGRLYGCENPVGYNIV